MEQIGSWVMPGFMALILLGAIIKGIPVFDAFLEGAREGMQTCVRILPTLIGLLTAVEMCRVSGLFDLVTAMLAPFLQSLGIPREVIPLFLLRPFSGGGSTALTSSILQQSGPDSPAGWIASVMMGSSETTFYALSVYYGAIGEKPDRGVLPAALLGDAAVFVGACLCFSWWGNG